MDRQIKGLASLSTLRTRKQGAIPGNDRGSDQLQIYILENNRALLQKELESVMQRKNHIEEKMKMIDENMAAIQNIAAERKPGKRDRPSYRKEEARQNPIKVMKIEY